MIRPATIDDIPRLVELGRAFHTESPEYREISFDENKTVETLAGLINGMGVVFVAISGGHIQGGIAGMVSEFWFSRERVAIDLALFIEPSSRHGLLALKLILTFKSWARNVGATQVKMGITTGINVDGTRRLYQSTGLEECGIMFKERIC